MAASGWPGQLTETLCQNLKIKRAGDAAPWWGTPGFSQSPTTKEEALKIIQRPPKQMSHAVDGKMI